MSTFDTTTTTTTTTTNINHKRRAKTPSFSSVLLDAIYHSIDDTYTDTDSSSSHHNHTRKLDITSTIIDDINSLDYDYVQESKQRRNKMHSDSSTLETINLRHAIMLDSWIENQPPQPQPQPQLKYHCNNRNTTDRNNNKFPRQKSVTNKSRNIDSSSSSSSSTCFTQPKDSANCLRLTHRPKRETSSRIFNKTKLKALKIYSDHKKSKQQQQRQQQPVSPGARIAAFLNSIFRHTTSKTMSSTSTCSSTASFSRSCLSKTTTSTKKSSSNRSVRFYPVNTVIIDEDHPKPYSNKCRKDNRRKSHDYYEEVLRFEMSSDEELMNIDDEDEDEDDGESRASSDDLFELENFNSIGLSLFNHELPVYGTTSLKNLF